MIRAVWVLVVAALLGWGVPAVAQTALKPGQFVWYDSANYQYASAGSGGVSLVVSIPQQLAFVYRDGVLIGTSTVSTGRDGKDTPVGEFTILEKKKFHRSNLYSNAPMPFMQRLTWDGIALHAGHLPGYPASHGCIRLPMAFARQLFALTEKGALVSVVDYPVDEPLDGPARPIIYADTRNLGGDSFNLVTLGTRTEERAPMSRPASWVLGPAKEIVQPLPSTGGGGR
jgi:hypothetical protein